MRRQTMGHRRWVTGFVLVALLFALPCSAEPLSAVELALEGAYFAVAAIDRAQTLQAVKDPERYRECNPILGKHPSTGAINTFFLAGTIVHPLITYLLPVKYRPYWQWITLSVRAGVTAHNASLGLKVRF